MAIKTFKPYTPARRNMTVSGFDGVDKKAVVTLTADSKTIEFFEGMV